MHHPRIRLEPDPVARIELVALAEHRDDLLTAEPRKHLRLRSRGLDYDDLGLEAVITTTLTLWSLGQAIVVTPPE